MWVDADGRYRADGPDCAARHGNCCDPCWLTRNPECHGCCRCVPKTICVKFTPDEQSLANGCYAVSTLIDWEWASSAGGSRTGAYAGTFLGLTIAIELEDVTPESYPRDRQQCRWAVTIRNNTTGITYIDADYPITRGVIGCPDEFGNETIVDNAGDPTGGKGCRDIAYSFTYPLSADCTGTITIAPYTTDSVAFVRSVAPDPNDPVAIYPSCGSIAQVCKHICVAYSIDGGQTTARRDFTWDAGSETWKRPRTCVIDGSTQYDSLRLYQDEQAQCRMQVFIKEVADATVAFGDACPEPECVGDFVITGIDYGSGVIFSDVDINGNTISAYCGGCECWNYICGTCRCVCPVLCLYYDNLLIENAASVYLELNWDGFNSWWGDAYFHVKLGADSCGNCVVTLPEELGDIPPVQIDNCGREISFTYQKDDLSILVNGACKKCTCAAPSGCCPQNDLPLSIYVDVSGDSFGDCGPDPYGGPVCPCLAITNLRLDFVPQVLACSAVWLGYKAITTCAGEFLVEVRISCCDQWQCQIRIYANENIVLSADNACHGGTGTIAFGTLIQQWEATDFITQTTNCEPLLLEFFAPLSADVAARMLFECPGGITVTVTE